MHYHHNYFQVPTQAPHHQHRILFSPMSERLPRQKWNIQKISPRDIVVRNNLYWKK